MWNWSLQDSYLLKGKEKLVCHLCKNILSVKYILIECPKKKI